MKQLFKLVKDFFELLIESGKQFIKDDAFRHAAALSYYSVFALPPIILILISSAGFIVGEAEIEDRLFVELSGLIGESGTAEVKAMIAVLQDQGGSVMATIIGLVTLLFSSTAVFYTLQGSLHAFWGVKDKVSGGFLRMLLDRVVSFAMVLSMGFLMLISMVVETVISAVNDIVIRLLPDLSYWIVHLTQFSVSLFIITTVFTLIYMFLPNAILKWKYAVWGGLFTAILFTIGQFGIGFYLGQTDFSSSYGPAGSVLIIFAWIFYSSLIIFYGAEFTYLLAERRGEPVRPK